MSGKIRSIRTDTVKRLIVDSGAIYKNFVSVSSLGTLIGTTRGGNTFTVESEIRTMEFDGVPGPMIGGERVVGINATISAAFVEISKELLALAQPGSDIDAVGATHNKISRDRDITAADYLGNLAIVGNVSGSSEYVICVIKNALSDGKLEISMADKDESAPKLTFKAHYDISDLNTEPWAIYYPIVGSASASSSSSASAS